MRFNDDEKSYNYNYNNRLNNFFNFNDFFKSDNGDNNACVKYDNNNI